MKEIKKVVISSAIAMALVSFGANAANQGGGVVNFKGSVIDAPCGIEQNSADQSIDFGQISLSHLTGGGISAKKDLDIKLVNCEPGKTVKVTFSGTSIAGATSELGTAGNTGTAIVIAGQDGKSVEFGTEGAAQTLAEGSNTLHYTSWVKKATNGTLAAGDFSAVANFNLAYN